MSAWKAPLFSCWLNPCECCCVCCCPIGGPCYVQANAAVKAKAHETCTIPFLLACFLGCIGTTINRGKIREAYKITEGSCFMDFITHLFCMPCAVCQESNEHTVRFVIDAVTEVAKDFDENSALNPPKSD
jgi:Cys-rich protein (TIGR01571 family)